MEMGFTHVVAINNEASRFPHHGFINHAIHFGEELTTPEQPAAMTMAMIKYPNRNHDLVQLFNGHACITCIQDGELRGFGIYAFFDTQAGAYECVKHYGELV